MAILRCIVGLGNPGSKYQSTRHNAGYWFVDRIAEAAGVSFRNEAKFFGELCHATVGGQRLLLLKPTTYMNGSGRAVVSLCRYQKIGFDQLLIAHDEIDLDAGVVRLKSGGGHGGHNGLRDIVKALGDNTFQRLRIGVGHPGNSREVVDYVLKPPSRDDAVAIDAAISAALDVLPQIVGGDVQAAMNRLHAAR